jgi:hypothetical protein
MVNRILEFSVRQRMLVVLGAVALAISGSLAWQRIPIDAFPEGQYVVAMGGIVEGGAAFGGRMAGPIYDGRGERIVAFFGSEGLYAFDMKGTPLWKKDLGTIIKLPEQIGSAEHLARAALGDGANRVVGERERVQDRPAPATLALAPLLAAQQRPFARAAQQVGPSRFRRQSALPAPTLIPRGLY